MADLDDFNRQTVEDLRQEAEESGLSLSELFFDRMAAHLEEIGEIETAEYASVEIQIGNKVARVDGSGGDPTKDDRVLSLVLCHYCDDAAVQSINAADANKFFRQLANFVTHARRGGQVTSAEQRGLDLAATVRASWPTLSKVKFILLTNANYTGRLDAKDAGSLGNVPVTYNIWDLTRLHRYESSAQAREALNVRFRDDFGGSIPALAASNNADDLESYLLVIPGAQLASVYAKWGARLMESNVRSFLQARGKVNKGIRDTIRESPEMFFSYNNGISATASEVLVEQTNAGLKIASAVDLQIVNGGQTTASLFAAARTSPNQLANVHVQMKLTVVPAARTDVVVPKISEFANSQNKVNAADFFSNHPFHVLVEEMSRQVLAPAANGSSSETRWFYERARGQFLVERSKGSDAEKRRFDKEFPKNQLFTKTDLAKVLFSFDGRPESVSRGAQKNFADFAKETGLAWTRKKTDFDVNWYRELVAKLITFKHLERAIPQQPWYPGGYRANLVTYGIAKLAFDAHTDEHSLDLARIWRDQHVPPPLSEALLRATRTVSEILLSPPAEIRNVSEWAKKSGCWHRVKNANVEYGALLQACVVTKEEAARRLEAQRNTRDIDRGINAVDDVISAGSQLWTELRTWCSSNRHLSHTEDGILRACERMNLRVPSEAQCVAAKRILDRASQLGFVPAVPLERVRLRGTSREH